MHISVQRRTASGAALNDTCLAGSGQPRRRVLFVNADFDLRAVVTRVLERENYEVRAVDHSGHAVLLSRNKQFDILVAELSGPDVSGPVLLDQLRRHLPGLTAVYFGNPGTPESVDQVLVRPFTREDLLRHLELAFSRAAASRT